MGEVFDIVLLLALPASGKSETRTFIKSFDEKTRKEVFHLGKDAQMDDFPYVHMMRRIDVELKNNGGEYVFFHAPDKTFKDPLSWGVLTLLLSDDYESLIEKKSARDDSVMGLMKRFDDARVRLNAEPLFFKNGTALIARERLDSVAHALEQEYRQMHEDRKKDILDDMTGATLIVEFARGGADGSSMPIPYGYEYNLKLLSPKILEKAVILYVWVTPEDSRRKNQEREDPNDPGSILAHCVPIEVMMKEYGCDDMDYMIQKSDRPGFIKVERAEKAYYIPVQRFDNRNDQTSFVRSKPWKEEDKKALYDSLKDNFTHLHESYKTGRVKA
ncbi:MAG: hypothetical protein AB2L14_05510 [Candidatus Xenobiia bacterium LiM19]